MNYVKQQQVRFTLREAWNTKYQDQLIKTGLERIVTPFRAVNNAGDLLCRQNYTCGGSSQTPQSRPGLKGLRLGAIFSNCDNTGIPASTCNGKYVYDSSDYITFVKQSAIQKQYTNM